ncbi:Hypothetical predicted protein [Cloeon dipterum]|uniref:ETS domain-containing protein n=1 Tax=Cloeon dipterum TaxID=197152 RepID=A0A8S1CKA5_9INSE|nr:Hypothetical predicted protein [Cloeon dipterum]
MKVLSLPSSLQLPSPSIMERMPFSPDLLWRYPLAMAGGQQSHPQPSQLSGAMSQHVGMDFKTHLPATLTTEPRNWSREDVLTFLRWCETEYDLPRFDGDTFQMNGKALCLLTKSDLNERAPGTGDVLHNVLQMLSKEAQAHMMAIATVVMQRGMPSSPVTPTARLSYGNWPLDLHSLQSHLVLNSNSVTLSPAPSTDSQQGSPQHHTASEHQTAAGTHFLYRNSDESEEETFRENTSPRRSPDRKPPAVSVPPPLSPKESTLSPTTPTLPFSPGLSPGFRGSREFFPNESSPTPEHNTNGRLLWDFLQQLLNDPGQKYTSYIAWKNHETGVFKIVDPAGLAKLWGIQKNHLSMNYDKMSRALRYYYRVNILRKVQGERHCYQFLRSPTELKNVKNISLLRPTAAASQQQQPSTPHNRASSVKMENDYSDMPTDLTMEGPTDLSSRSASDLLELRWGKQQDESIKCESAAD